MAFNFSLWLFIFTFSSFIIYIIDKIFFEKTRYKKVTNMFLKKNIDINTLSKKEKEKIFKAPFLAELARGFFIVLLIVFCLRSFVAEPFRIPTGSMLPTLQIGDFVLVNKFSYGLKNPLNDDTLIKIGKPKKGDIIVFKYPVNPEITFIKRVIGVSGDKISYIDKVLYINGKKIPKKYINQFLEKDNSLVTPSKEFNESLGNYNFNILNYPVRQGVNFTNLVVPENSYFVMGDNRDNSEDSRYWGFVKEKYIIGKAFIVWFNFNDFNINWSQIGKSI